MVDSHLQVEDIGAKLWDRPEGQSTDVTEPQPLPSSEPDSIFHRPGLAWSQSDLGSDFDLLVLSAVATLDPDGLGGVVEEVLSLFQRSLEPVLVRLESYRAAESIADIRFEAHKLYSAAGQLGAVRLARACNDLLNRFRDEHRPPPQSVDPEFDGLLIQLIGEIIRVQRKLTQLLPG